MDHKHGHELAVVELAVGSGDSREEHQKGYDRELAALVVALAALAGAFWHRYRRRAG